MKKKTARISLTLGKKRIMPLNKEANSHIAGGAQQTLSCLETCFNTCYQCSPTTAQPGSCPNTNCLGKHTENCPTTSNMCPTSPEVNCTQTA